MKRKLGLSTVSIAIALVLPVVAGCKTCEGGACATSACETGKAVCKTDKCGGGSCKTDAVSCARKCGVQKAEDAAVSTATLKTLLDAKTPLLLFDARTGKYDDGRRIPGAKALSPEASAEEIAKAAPSKDALIVTYCSNVKCQASPKLAAALGKLGYKNVLEYSAGIAGWAEAGNAVEEPGKQD